MRLVMTLATALLALGLGACFEPHFDNMGGFKCPCGKGWYCDKVGGEGKCFQGVRPDWPPATKKDTGSTKPPDKGSTTKKDTGSTTKKDTGSTKPPDKGNTTKQDKGVKPPLDKGAPPKKDQGTPPQLDKGPDMPGTTTNKCKLTAFKPVPYSSDFNHDFDFRLVPLKKHHLASWGVGANTSAKMFWGYLLPSGQWSVSSVAAAKDGGDETAIVGNTATGTKYHEVIFYASKITTKTKIRALLANNAKPVTVNLDQDAGIARYLEAAPAAKAGQFWVAYQTSSSNVRLVLFDAEDAGDRIKATVNLPAGKVPAHPKTTSPATSYGHHLSLRLVNNQQLQLAHYSTNPNHIHLNVYSIGSKAWGHLFPDAKEFKKLNVMTGSGTSFSTQGLAFTGHDGTVPRVTLWASSVPNDRGPGDRPSFDGDAYHQAIVNAKGNSLVFRSRMKGGLWWESSLPVQTNTPTRVQVQRTQNLIATSKLRNWDVVWSAKKVGANSFKLFSARVSCNY